MPRPTLILLVSILFCQCSWQSLRSCRADDTLRHLRTGVRQASTSEPRKKKSFHLADEHMGYGDDDDDDDDGFFTKLIIGAVAIGASSPYWVPRGLLGDDTFDSANFGRHPYCESCAGIMACGLSCPVDSYNWLARVRTEAGTDFGNLTTVGGQVLLDTAMRLGVDGEFYYFRESRLGPGADDLWTGDLNLLFRFAQCDTVQMRSGIGVNWLSDRLASDFGFNFTYGGDWFPRKPWIVSTEIDWGRIGSASLLHARATTGVAFRRYELFTGYDYRSVGRPGIHQWVNGVQLWY